ncbi:jg2709 [Pararge aegeria aegeria]|uniref:Jg2709 protein n=1 Tax=Pararge aegeria aegeria TaxID=348720 RepID=A0A8S4QN05_9NEOP|nr:jg2709 [Pararge aegeria aegeria]
MSLERRDHEANRKTAYDLRSGRFSCGIARYGVAMWHGVPRHAGGRSTTVGQRLDEEQSPTGKCSKLEVFVLDSRPEQFWYSYLNFLWFDLVRGFGRGCLPVYRQRRAVKRFSVPVRFCVETYERYGL